MSDWWTSIVESWPYGERMLFTLVGVVGYNLGSLPLYLFGIWLHYNPGNYFDKYRVRPNAPPPAERLVRESLFDTLLGHVVTIPVFVYLALYPLAKWLGMEISGPVPSVWRIAVEVGVSYFFADLLTYWLHRWCHEIPWVYKNIHARHHRFTTSISLATEFAHPLESFFVATLAALFGPLLFRSHIITFAIWMAIRMVEAVEAHMGYDFPFSPVKGWSHGALGHGWHHSHNKGIYGSSPFWDWLCGTDKLYKEWLKKRD